MGEWFLVAEPLVYSFAGKRVHRWAAKLLDSSPILWQHRYSLLPKRNMDRQLHRLWLCKRRIVKQMKLTKSKEWKQYIKCWVSLHKIHYFFHRNIASGTLELKKKLPITQTKAYLRGPAPKKQKKKITQNYHLLTKVESGKCLRVTVLTAQWALQTCFPTLLRHNVTITSIAVVTRRHFQVQLLLADGNFKLFSFSAYFSSSFLF